MEKQVTWIDDIDIEVEGAVILATAHSGCGARQYRMSRATFREYIERAIRQLDEADERDRCQVLPFGKRASH
jgi:hypothetical protein